jgi:hypothetical protein
MNKLKQELKQLKIQIRVGIDQKQISQDWGILLLDNLEEAINYTRCCKSDSELLPTKQYEIEFSNHLRCGINVTNNEINVIGAIDGWGNGVGKDVITVKEL